MNRDVPAQAALLSRSARAALAAALAAAFVGSACAADAAPVPQAAASSPASIPVADFFRHPAMTSPAISPNGRYVAVLAPTRDTGFRGLMIIDLDEPAKSKLAAHFDDADIDTALWIDDEHLLITLTNARAQVDFGFFEAGFAPHTVLRDGSQLPLPAYGLGNSVVAQMRDGSGDLIIEKVHTAHVDEPDHVVPMRINLFKHTEKRLVEGAPPHVMSWTFDHQGIARVGEAIEEDKVRLYTKPAPDAPWTLVSTSSYIDNVRVLGVGPGNTIYVAARKSGQDTASLIAFDTTKTIDSSPVLVSMQGYDFDGRLVIDPDDGRLLGVKYRTDAAGVLWFDPAMKKIQARVDELLPGLINDIHCIRCGRQARMVVTSHSDRQPDLFAVYDSAKDVLMKVGASRPWIDRRMMASTELRSVTARDGLPLPVYITRPRGAKGPMPTVVLVHGGPFVRGVEWRWSRDAQFLASRGYAVIEPEFRGSQGYGFRHYKAGWKQWGLAMQDDIADVTRWSAAQGIADPARVCIAGASYGGYATLMGLVRDPDLYRCGVEWVGVTDLDLVKDLDESDMSDQYRQFGFPVLIGDSKADAKQFEATSPVRQAARIKKPVLMAYGRLDRRVPIEHGVEMRNALRKANVDVEWIEYAAGGHGWFLDKDNEDFYTRVDAFLAKHLKNAP